MRKRVWLLGLLLQTTAIADQQQLQAGAQVFMDYCSGCHSLQYLRYENLAEDLGLSKFPGRAEMKGNILTALPQADAKIWFGPVPPDLSLKAREKGKRWLQQYLQGFYQDKTRPFGVNNHRLPNLGMPDVMASLPQEQRDQKIQELLAFLLYSAEPQRQIRYRMGFPVVLFLMLMACLCYALKRSCWKNVQNPQ